MGVPPPPGTGWFKSIIRDRVGVALGLVDRKGKRFKAYQRTTSVNCLASTYSPRPSLWTMLPASRTVALAETWEKFEILQAPASANEGEAETVKTMVIRTSAHAFVNMRISFCLRVGLGLSALVTLRISKET